MQGSDFLFGFVVMSIIMIVRFFVWFCGYVNNYDC